MSKYVRKRNEQARQHKPVDGADLQEYLRDERPGDVPPPEIRAVMGLAREIEHDKDPDYVSVSWASQCEAEEYARQHGLAGTLDEMFRRRAARQE